MQSRETGEWTFYGSSQHDHLRARFGAAFQAGDIYLAGQADSPLEWLVEGFIPKGYLVVLGGTSKTGKSCFVTALSMAVAKGEPFLGRPAMSSERRTVLWCAYEESRKERAEILRHFAPVPSSFLVTHERPLIDTPEGLDMLRFWTQETKASLIVIDPLYAAIEAQSLAHGPTARNALDGLKRLCADENVAAIVIHHLNKSGTTAFGRERFADSNQILAAASMDILMDSADIPDGTRAIQLRCRGRGDFANRTWSLLSKGITHFEEASLGNLDAPRDITMERSVLKALQGRQLTTREMAQQTGLHEASLRNCLANMAFAGELQVVGKRGRFKVYALPNVPFLAAGTGNSG